MLLRKKRETLFPGRLCVERNGLTAKTRKFIVATGFSSNHNLGVFNNNVDAVERAFTERYFLCKDGEGFRPAFNVSDQAFREENLVQFRGLVMENMPRLPVMSREQTVSSFRGSKQKTYQQALVSLSKDELSEVDAILSSFGKFEKWILVRLRGLLILVLPGTT